MGCEVMARRSSQVWRSVVSVVVVACFMNLRQTVGFMVSPSLRTAGAASRAARAGALSMSGLPPDFDPMSPSLDHLSVIDKASKSRAEPRGEDEVDVREALPRAVKQGSPYRVGHVDDVTERKGYQTISQAVYRFIGLMIGGAGGVAEDGYSDLDGARIGPPPDLPSLLLHNRIVYLGMPLVPAVTELIIAELLYLNYESGSKPVYMYINTPGTSTPDGRAIGFETEAFAISDCMNYIKPPVYTIGVGQAFGLGAMLLASGEKGHRSALPNASIMLHQPRSMARGQASDIAIKAKEVIANRRTATQMLAEACGKPFDEVLQDSSRTFYMSPDEAVSYGLIDKVLNSSKKEEKKTPTFLDALSGRSSRPELYED